LANKFNKSKRTPLSDPSDDPLDFCPCCDLAVPRKDELLNPCCVKDKEFAMMGPGFPLLFQFMLYTVIYLFICLLIMAPVSSAYNANISEGDIPSIGKIYTEGGLGQRVKILTSNQVCILILVIFSGVYFQFVRRVFEKKLAELDELAVTPSDFTIMLQNWKVEENGCSI
jgi:hypothetical protein